MAQEIPSNVLFYLGAMDADKVEKIIRGPLGLYKAFFKDGSVSSLLEDLLPKKRKSNQMTLEIIERK